MTPSRRQHTRAATLALLAASALTLALPRADAAFAARTSVTINTFNAATAWCTSSGQKLGNPGFETGTATPWTVTLPTEINNLITEPPHTGQWDAWLAPIANSPQLLSQTVTLPTGCTTATLSFYLHTDFKGAQGSGTMTAQLLNTGGTVLTTLATFNATNTSGYTRFTYNINSYLGQTITLKFNATASGVRQPNFVIDDTNLTIG